MTVYSLSNPTRVYPSWASQYVEVGYIRLRWERVGVRGYSLTIDRNPSPGSHLRCDVAEAALRRSFSRTAAEGGLCLSHKGRGAAELVTQNGAYNLHASQPRTSRPFPSSLPALRRDQLHPAVERPAGLSRVGADRREQADTGGAQPWLGDAIALHQLLGDRLGAAARQIEIVVERALAVGVADDEDVELRLARQQLGDLFQRRAAFRLDHRLVGVEVDAIQRDVAGVAEALGHRGGIHHLVLDGAEFGDDQLRMDFLVVLADDNARIGLASAVETGLGLASSKIMIIETVDPHLRYRQRVDRLRERNAAAGVGVASEQRCKSGLCLFGFDI